jgi:hypothetical protein
MSSIVSLPKHVKDVNSPLYIAIACFSDSAKGMDCRPEHQVVFQRAALRLRFGGKLTDAEERQVWRMLRFYAKLG